jgi:DNA polymerase III subunit beta
MKTIISTNELRKFLSATNQIRNTALPICDDVLLEFTSDNCKAIVTDLETTVICNIPCKGEVFNICVSRMQLTGFLKSYKDEVLQVENNGLKTSFSGFVITGHESDEFPLLPEMQEAKSLVFSPALNYELIEAANFVGADDLRPVMSGVCLTNKNGCYDVVSTNSHKLYEANLGTCDKDVEQFECIVGSPNIIASIIKSLKLHNEAVNFSFDKTNARLTYSDIEITTRLIDGKYPNYKAVIPEDNPLLLQVSKAVLFGAIDMVKNASCRSTQQVVFEKTETGLKVIGEDIDFQSYMEVEIPCEFNAETGFKIAFNYNFMLELFRSNIGDELNIELSAPNRACVTRSYHRMMLLMPVMINVPRTEVETSEVETEIESDEVEA